LSTAARPERTTDAARGKYLFWYFERSAKGQRPLAAEPISSVKCCEPLGLASLRVRDVERIAIENGQRFDRPIEFLRKVYDGEAVDFVVHLKKLRVLGQCLATAMAVRGVSEKNAIRMIWRHEAQGRWFRWPYG
jgi:hypothetical protein